MITIGIDTGGTCTDAVIYNLETREILATGKTLTTKSNLEIGIANALDELPEELLHQAEMFALSTTLATNACVENKGCRAKLLIIGTTEDMIQRLEKVLADYGITDSSQIVVLDGKPENLFSDPLEPDWEGLEKKIPELFHDCDSVGIVQAFSSANGGRFEMTALRVLEKNLTIPLTIAYNICTETDFMKVCASTLLNARLIPLIAEFMLAVQHVMEKRGMNIPLSIVRSDGTLMSREMARSCPVETLLCGPAASVIGGSELTQEDNAIIVDMGGTTTDLAMIRNGDPIIATTGIHIGQYKTTIHGLDADATFLGGDSAVRIKDKKLFIDTTRIIPISILASTYQNVLPDLTRFVEKKLTHTRNVHEFFVLQKDIANAAEYTDEEKRICDILREKPRLIQDFAKILNGGNIYHLNTTRLEQEGILIRSGLTPTDMMVIKGDLKLYNRDAAEILLRHISLNTGLETSIIPDLIYDLVVQKLYKTIGLFLLQHEYPKESLFENMESADFILNAFYEKAMRTLENDPAFSTRGNQKQLASPFHNITDLQLKTPLTLIGIGAPTHVFLPKTAQLFGTKAIVPELARVANALGAAACNQVSRLDYEVHAVYEHGYLSGFTVMDGFTPVFYKKLEPAIAAAKEILLKKMKEKAEFQGLGANPIIEIKMEESRIGNPETGVLMQVTLHAVARK